MTDFCEKPSSFMQRFRAAVSQVTGLRHIRSAGTTRPFERVPVRRVPARRVARETDSVRHARSIRCLSVFSYLSFSTFF